MQSFSPLSRNPGAITYILYAEGSLELSSTRPPLRGAGFGQGLVAPFIEDNARLRVDDIYARIALGVKEASMHYFARLRRHLPHYCLAHPRAPSHAKCYHRLHLFDIRARLREEGEALPDTMKYLEIRLADAIAESVEDVVGVAIRIINTTGVRYGVANSVLDVFNYSLNKIRTHTRMSKSVAPCLTYATPADDRNRQKFREEFSRGVSGYLEAHPTFVGTSNARGIKLDPSLGWPILYGNEVFFDEFSTEVEALAALVSASEEMCERLAASIGSAILHVLSICLKLSATPIAVFIMFYGCFLVILAIMQGAMDSASSIMTQVGGWVDGARNIRGYWPFTRLANSSMHAMWSATAEEQSSKVPIPSLDSLLQDISFGIQLGAPLQLLASECLEYEVLVSESSLPSQLVLQQQLRDLAETGGNTSVCFQGLGGMISVGTDISAGLTDWASANPELAPRHHGYLHSFVKSPTMPIFSEEERHMVAVAIMELITRKLVNAFNPCETLLVVFHRQALALYRTLIRDEKYLSANSPDVFQLLWKALGGRGKALESKYLDALVKSLHDTRRSVTGNADNILLQLRQYTAPLDVLQSVLASPELRAAMEDDAVDLRFIIPQLPPQVCAYVAKAAYARLSHLEAEGKSKKGYVDFLLRTRSKLNNNRGQIE
ncbi:hypothetical protein BOTBODRAFT_180508 [Botryobasidium botryosum FD-172 SS1]|uniref:Uncharacterized protein n=1 Tax=Botryobasidium botryosum (strain FD-172 SS1) TaxID=930990 RepID=A0A067LW86_BOTB1|nr:hypothetical protein BOTBODRAFT_180508 [Botryobasidium botryosum FD-172 SS1]